MTDYLPDVIMPVDDPNDPNDPDSDDKELELSHELDDLEDDIIPEPIKREKVVVEDVFGPLKILPVKEDQDNSEDLKDKEEEIIPVLEEPKKIKKTRKKRGPASQETKDRLQLARLKGLETRRKNALLKKEEKELLKKDKELRGQLVVKQRNILKKKLAHKDEFDEDYVPPEPKIQIKEKIVPVGYTQDQLDDAVSRAVEQSVSKVETLRKKRKEVKKKEGAKKAHDDKVFKDINGALKNDGYGMCFSGF